jgi:hypothetical protein
LEAGVWNRIRTSKMTDGAAHNAIKRLLPGILWFVVVASPQALTAAADAELPC